MCNLKWEMRYEINRMHYCISKCVCPNCRSLSLNECLRSSWMNNFVSLISQPAAVSKIKTKLSEIINEWIVIFKTIGTVLMESLPLKQSGFNSQSNRKCSLKIGLLIDIG